MDLADIRKKARTQKEPPQVPTVLDELLPDEQRLTPSFAESGGGYDFWSEMAGVHFATEEEYTQGLISVEKVVDGEQSQWVGFFLGDEEYALDIAVVSELIKPRALTELPQVPNYICGIITLRGEVIPVIDLTVRLGLKVADLYDVDLQRVIVCDGPEQRVGLLVDRISQVVRMSAANVEKPHLVGDNPAAAFVAGIGRKDGRMLIKLLPDKILEIEAQVEA